LNCKLVTLEWQD